jgi:NAD(P) transhydrogenase subunit alpha
MALQVGIPRETYANEKRVAGTPDTVLRLQKLGFAVAVEKGAGAEAGYSDALYGDAGAALVDVDALWDKSDIMLKVRMPNDAEVGRARKGQVLISFIMPAQNKALVEALAKKGATVIAMDAVPRITRAQKMDALSSMANIAGYRAVVEAAHNLPRLFAGQITAAGKMPPAKVLIIGAGVAGLAAIGAARGLGAVVRAFDTRPVVREQVQSMGAEFLEIVLPPGVAEDGTGQGGYAKEMSTAYHDAEVALFSAQSKDVDVIITTALIPGKPPPKLITAAMVATMRPGSVIVDLAAEQGGNCELTRAGERVVSENGVSVLGYTDLPSRMAAVASQLYGTNLFHILDDMTRAKDALDKPGAVPAERFRVDFDDEVVRGATVAKDGEVTWPPPKKDPPPASTTKPAETKTSTALTTTTTTTTSPATTTKAPVAHRPSKGSGHHAPAGAPGTVPLLIAGAVLVAVGVAAPPAFLGHLIVFVLSCFIGYQVIWNVTPALHTPLMSVTNAISGIILVGGLLHASDGFDKLPIPTILGAAAILIATINIAGGFLVTQRMLKMFRRGDS